MTERAQLVEHLLRGFLDWVPGPPGSRYASAPGPAPGKRRRCETCASTGRVVETKQGRRPCQTCRQHRGHHGCLLCLVCDGTGWRPRRAGETGEDEYLNPGTFGETWTIVEDRRTRDRAIAKLESLQLVREGDEGTGDRFTFALDCRDAQYRQGSFAELEQVLHWLRDVQPQTYSLVMSRLVYQDVDATPLRSVLEQACELISARMPEEIRVPSHLFPDEAARARYRSLRFGRTEAHARDRAARNGDIVGKLGAGWPVGSIAAYYGLTQSWIYAVRASAMAGATAAAL